MRFSNVVTVALMATSAAAFPLSPGKPHVLAQHSRKVLPGSNMANQREWLSPLVKVLRAS